MDNFANRPILLEQNKHFRRYPGGREMDKFRNRPNPIDDNSPEAWVGSTTLCNDHEQFPGERRGQAKAKLDNGETPFLKDLIDMDPVAMLGQKHVNRCGTDTSVLLKLLDAEKQLGFQCHPDRKTAKRLWNSDFGKEESWYVLSTRDDTAEPPYVLLGFKEGISGEKFEALYNAGDIAAIDNLLHKIPVKAGDMFYVGAGVPHGTRKLSTDPINNPLKINKNPSILKSYFSIDGFLSD